MNCQPCERRQNWLNAIVPGLGDWVAGMIAIAMASKWYLRLYMWIYGETPGERIARRNFEYEMDDVNAQIDEE